VYRIFIKPTQLISMLYDNMEFQLQEKFPTNFKVYSNSYTQKFIKDKTQIRNFAKLLIKVNLLHRQNVHFYKIYQTTMTGYDVKKQLTFLNVLLVL